LGGCSKKKRVRKESFEFENDALTVDVLDNLVVDQIDDSEDEIAVVDEKIIISESADKSFVCVRIEIRLIKKVI